MGLFEALCDLPVADRHARLATLRAEDADLADALEDMLGVDDDEPAFMATPVLRCPVCHETFPGGAEFCPTHGSRLRPMLVDTDPLLGQVLDGRYRIDSVLGRGGMGVVYRGHQINVGRDVAIKVLRHDLQHHPEVSRRFEREARIIAGLRHPNTLKLIDFGHTPFGTLYIVNPLLKGRPLDRVITEDGPLGVRRTLSLMRQVTNALAEAHDASIVHRDLKPANVFVELVGGQEVFKVLDFGIAKLSAETTDHTATGALVGTPAYMSPEQVSADQTIDGRSDLYSLGVLAYVCLTGDLPWANVTPTNVTIKHLHEPPVPLRQVLSDVPPAIDALVMQLLSKAPADRPADAHTLRDAIGGIERTPGDTADDIIRQVSPLALMPTEAPQLDLSSSGRRAVPYVLGGVLLVTAALVFWVLRSPGSADPATPASAASTATAPSSAAPDTDAASAHATPSSLATPPSASPVSVATPQTASAASAAPATAPTSDAAPTTTAPKKKRRPPPRRRRPASKPKLRKMPDYVPAPGHF